MKKEKIMDLIIMIMAIVLIVLYGLQINEHPVSYYICGVCWSSVATMRLCKALFDR